MSVPQERRTVFSPTTWKSSDPSQRHRGETERVQTHRTRSLVEAFDTIWNSPSSGARFLGEILHTLVWAQCLGNANHRTTIMFLQGLMAALYVPFPWYAEEPGSAERFKTAVESFSDASHRLLDRQSEFGYSRQQLKERHKELAVKWVERQFGDQSRVETMIEPQRSMAFFS